MREEEEEKERKGKKEKTSNHSLRADTSSSARMLSRDPLKRGARSIRSSGGAARGAKLWRGEHGRAEARHFFDLEADLSPQEQERKKARKKKKRKKKASTHQW